ncbi:hypothetical protein RQM47_03370 [Rubrivirga sp. S365]|uniref:CopG family transcriptional regulator n=1 Tax=Rubrivirga litoralis TaxID=3075598 RepID=A0ABU3BLJ7_9BACT|nr:MULTISPECIES: hypothetical protein [unclassified Rubrivirga]MDT0630161.1 hypothetical protein [Rubrivirga sp. F394]MDT7855672.1 hypothetical protein [Rubrivirga sp. S365]
MPTVSPKQVARRLIDRLDDDASFEDIQYELYVVQQVERGLREVEEGQSVTHEEARTRLSRWLGSTPRSDG